MEVYKGGFEEKVLQEPYESVAQEIEVVYIDSKNEETDYSQQSRHEFHENRNKIDDMRLVEVCVKDVENTAFGNNDEFASDMHCLEEVEISSQCHGSENAGIDEWTTLRNSSETSSSSGTFNNSITSTVSCTESCTDSNCCTVKCAENNTIDSCTANCAESISIDVRCQTPDDSSISRSHDSGVSFTRKTFSLIQYDANVDKSNNSELTLGSKRLSTDFRADNRAKLFRELDLCHMRDVKQVLRTPSPAGNRHFSYIDRSDVENFSVDCYFRSNRTLSPCKSLTPNSESSKDGLKLLDFNIPHADSMHYGSNAGSTRSVYVSRMSRSCKESSGVQTEHFKKLCTNGEAECMRDPLKHVSIQKKETSSSQCSLSNVQSSQYDTRQQLVCSLPIAQQNNLLIKNDTSNKDSCKRPPHSYMNLIQMALCSAPDYQMTLRDIYDWIERNFPYYKHIASRGWKNSVRHNLSLYDIFIRKKSSGPIRPKGCSYWTMSSQATKSFQPIKQQQQSGRPTSAEIAAKVSSMNAIVSGSTISSDNETDSSWRNRLATKKGPVPLLPKPQPVLYQHCNRDQASFNPSQSSGRMPSIISSTGCIIQAKPSISHDDYLRKNFSVDCIPDYDGRYTNTSPITANNTCRDSGPKKRRYTSGMSGPRRKCTKTSQSQPIKIKSKASVSSASHLNNHDVSGSRSHNSSSDQSLTELCGFVDNVVPFVVAIDDSISLGSSFSSSDLRQQLSHLNFNCSVVSGGNSSQGGHIASVVTDQRLYVSDDRQTESGVWTSFEDVQKGLPKPKIYQRHRRKQEFKILRSPSETLCCADDTTHNFDVSDSYEGTKQKLFLDTPSRINVLESNDSNVVTSDSNLNADTMSSSLTVHDTGVTSSSPLTVDADLLCTPSNRDYDENDDDNLMLFTPFRGSGTNIFSSPSAWPSPIAYMNCFSPISAGLSAVLPSPERQSARTSTPLLISNVDGTPDGKLSSSSSSKTLMHVTPSRVDYSRVTPDYNVCGFDSPFGGTPGRWEAPFGDRSPPEIRFHSPTIKRLLSECEHRGNEQISLADISHALNFSPSR